MSELSSLGAPAADPARKRRLGKVLIIAALVVAVLLVVGDRLGAFLTERVVANRIVEQLERNEIGVSGQPDVTFEGFPFFTQVVGGEYEAIRVVVDDLRTAGISITDLELRAVDVQAAPGDILRGQGSIIATEMTGSIVLSYSSIAGLLNQPDLTIVAENGTLKLRTPVTFAGHTFVVVATGTVALQGGLLRLTVEDIRPDGAGLPPGAQRVLNALAQFLTQDLKLPTLPYDLTVHGVEVSNAGLEVHASAKDVPLSR